MTMDTETLWNTFQDRLKRFITRRVSRTEDAEDILQSIFEKIHNQGEALNKVNNISAWLYTITRNEIINHYRRSKELYQLPETLAVTDSEQDTDRYEKEFYIECMKVFIGNLSEEEQGLLNKVIDGTSLKQISDQTNKPYPTIKAKVQRSREKIRKDFIRCCNIHNLSEHGDNNCSISPCQPRPSLKELSA